MSRKQLLAVLLTLSAAFSCANARGDVTGTTTVTEQQGRSSQDNEESIRHLIEKFSVAQVPLAKAIEAAEQLHPGSRTASISFDCSASPVYRVLTVKHADTWENIIDANTGNTAGPETTLSLSELDEEDRSTIVAFRSVRQELSDAVRVAEKAAAGKALGGGLVRQHGKFNFVVVVASGDSLKEVMLEPPKAGRQGSDRYRLTRP